MTNRNPADLSTRIRATSDRLSDARIVVAGLEREMKQLLHELEALPVQPRRPGRPRKEESEPTYVPRKRPRARKPAHPVPVGQA